MINHSTTFLIDSILSFAIPFLELKSSVQRSLEPSTGEY